MLFLEALGHLRGLGVDVMTNKSRSFLRVSVVPALLLGGVCAIAQAAPTNWSDPATWPNRKVPIAGDKVTIGRDKDVILDVSPPALGGLSIDGKLTFSNDADLELTTEWIMLHGELAIGSEAAPHTRNATITLTNTVPNEDVMAGMGDRGIMISGGTLNLHGDRTNTWTKLATRREPAARRSKCWTPSGWRVGDEIVLASTDFDPRQAERRTIAADQRQQAHARPQARLHALRQDHLRRGRARRSRPADAQHQDPGVSGCGAVVLRRPHHGDALEQDVRLGRRAEPHGPAHDAGALSDPLASGGRRARASTSRTPPSTTPTTAA